MRFKIVVGALVCTSGLLSSSVAWAGVEDSTDDSGAPAVATETGAELSVSTGSEEVVPRPSRPAGGPSPWMNCATGSIDDLLPSGFVALVNDTIGRTSPQQTELRELVRRSPEERAAATGFAVCDRRDGTGTGGWLTSAGVPWDPTPALVVEAERILVLPEPEVVTSPPRGAVLPVGLPVWFWATNGQALSETASVPGVSVTVDATVVSMSLEVEEPDGRVRSGGGSGEGRSRSVTVACDGVGEVYDPARKDPWAASGCSRVFDWPGEVTVTASVTWNLAWSSTTGAAGTLDPVTRTSTFTLDLVELQAVVD